MGELRKDYLLNRYVIIANDRSKRPQQFTPKKIANEKICYFCPGNEHLTPPEIERFPQNADSWQIRVFPNKYPAVKNQGKYQLITDDYFFTYSDAYGYHEVIVETPNHEETLADLSEENISNVLKMLKKRIEITINCPNIKYVALFKNHGASAGTSIQHTHCQLIAYNIIPDIIIQKESAVKKFNQDPFGSIINIEKESLRKCFENPKFIAFTPYASRFPYEIWVLPKRHLLNITEFEEADYAYLADIMKKILAKLKKLGVDYNFYFQYGIEKMRFHIEFIPRIAHWAGFEFSTGTVINTVSPESAAEFYRKK